MRFNTIINRYIFLEMIPPFFINLMVFSFIFLMARILDITKLIVNYNISILSVLLIMAYSMPSFLIFVLPISVMMGVLLAFLRYSNDHELIALRACGISIFKMLPPVFIFCIMGCLMTAFMTIYGSHKGRLASKEELIKIVSSNINIGLKEKTFNDNFKDVMLYINRMDSKTGFLHDIFIQDRRSSKMVSTIVASKAKFLTDPEKQNFQLRLYSGIINQVDRKHKSVHSINFETYNFNISLSKIVSKEKKRKKSRKEMSLKELHDSLKTNQKDEQYLRRSMEYHKKFSIPFACLVLGCLSLPLGIQSRSAKRSFGVVVGLFFFLLYYLILSAGMALCEAGHYHPFLAMWTPNILIGAISAYFIFMTTKQRKIQIVYKLERWIKGVFIKLRKRLQNL
ncbi:lipopolysaccharide export system permease protein [Candidatus Magnetomoraceae bacterium gMMP-1]